VEILEYCANHTIKELFNDVNKVGKNKYFYNGSIDDSLNILKLIPIIVIYNIRGLLMMPVTVYDVKHIINNDGTKSVIVYIEEFKEQPKITLNKVTDDEYNIDYCNNNNYIVLYDNAYNLCSFKNDDNNSDMNYMNVILNTLKINTLDELAELISESVNNMMIHYNEEI